jgi:hypothetical protein
MAKYIFTLLLILYAFFPRLFAQTVDWVYLEAAAVTDNCTSNTNCATGEICFGISYTPSVSGRVTSYTFGFVADCPGGSLPGIVASSCTMTDNTDIINACATSASRFLLTASGNNGNIQVVAGTPVILHQVCLPLAGGTSIEFEEEPVTDLTLSIDLAGSGDPFTEFPSFANFVANTSNCSGNLPVTWESFTAQPAGKTARLDWETSAEIGHDRFVVEHGMEPGRFTDIGEVREANAENLGHRAYEFIHDNPATGINYYRIRQIDYDGAYSYSEIKTVVFSEGTATEFALSPNPTDAALTLHIAARNEPTPVAVLSMTGRLLFTASVAPGIGQISLPTENLPAGMYLVRVDDIARRFIKR